MIGDGTQSNRELQFARLWELLAPDQASPTTQHRFCERKWRFDFCWPERRVAVEIQGGHWSGGRHVRAKGFQADCERHNIAMLLGWRLLYFTGDDLDQRPTQVVAQVKALLCAN